MVPASCHPDRKHQAKGLCLACYNKQRYNSDRSKKYTYERRTRNRNEYLAYMQAYHKDHPDKPATECSLDEITRRRAYQKHYRNKIITNGWTNARKDRIGRRYGLSLTEFNERLAAQNYTCPICLQFLNASIPKGNESMCVVDHDHSTGFIRGILHSRCNRMTVAAVEHCLEDLPRACAYLAKGTMSITADKSTNA